MLYLKSHHRQEQQENRHRQEQQKNRHHQRQQENRHHQRQVKKIDFLFYVHYKKSPDISET